MDNIMEAFCPDCRGEAHADKYQFGICPWCWEEHLQGQCFRDFHWDEVEGAVEECSAIPGSVRTAS